MNILILDMDGTVRIKKGGTPGDLKAGFIQSPEDQEIIPGAVKAIESYAQEGWLIVGASNQGGVAAGKKTLKSCCQEQQYTLSLIHELTKIYFCPDYQGDELWLSHWGRLYLESKNLPFPKMGEPDRHFASFRKPEPGMIEYILKTHNPDRVLFVGDRPEDEQAASKAGVDFQWAKDWWR